MKSGNNDNTIVKKVVNEETGEERIITLHRDHAKPSNRRQFLSTGLLGFSGMIVAPSILNVLARPEFAFGQAEDNCAAASGANPLPAFITVNLSGGASLSGNLPPLGQDRLPLPSYGFLGLGGNSGVFTNNAIGSDMFQGVRVAGTRNAGVAAGHFWVGLTQVGAATGTTIERTSLINLCVTSNDDTNTNMADASGLIMAAGVSGELLPNLGTSGNTPTGVGQQAGGGIRPAAPLIVRNFVDIEGALRPAGALATRLTNDRRKKLLELVGSLSGSQARAVATPGSATGTTLARIVECATGKNIELSSSTDPGIDPGLDPGVAAAWGINPANKGGGLYAQAGMVYNALKGNSATAGIDLGGYDYHGNTRANTNTADRNAGVLVGRILQTAAILNKPVMIHVVSDGSVSTAGRDVGIDAAYTNDSGVRGMSYLLVFNPTARPRIKDDQFRHQIGFFTNGQGASDQTVVGTPTKAAVAILANYLAFAGQSSKLESIAPGVFSGSDLNEVVRIVG